MVVECRTVVSVLKLFPFQMQDELFAEIEPAGEDGKEKVFLIVKYLRDLRRRRQGMLRTKELSSGSSGKLKEENVEIGQKILLLTSAKVKS